MSVFHVTGAEVLSDIFTLLKCDWVLLLGDGLPRMSVIQRVYPLGTPENDLVVGYDLNSTLVCIGKKTDALRECLGDPPDFDKTMAFVFPGGSVDNGDGSCCCAVQQIYANPNLPLKTCIAALLFDGIGEVVP